MRVLALTLLLLLPTGLYARGTAPSIHVVYPKPDQTVHAVDSTFIFGHVTNAPDNDNWFLEINGAQVNVHSDGGFLAFLPVAAGAFSFDLALKSTRADNLTLAETSVPVNIPVPVHTLSMDSLAIVRDHNPPLGDLVLATGDELRVSFWGTPNCRAWFSIQGVIDSVPMAETPPEQQPYWGEAVFGVGAVPDTMLVGGIYTGFYEVPESVSVADTNIVYHLAPPSREQLAEFILSHPHRLSVRTLIEYLEGVEINTISGYTVSLNPPDYPFTVEFSDSVQILRHGPRKGYFSIFQTEGIRALVVGREGDWYRMRLSHSQYAWADSVSVMKLATGMVPPHSFIRSIRTSGDEMQLRVEFPLKGRHPFRIYEDDPRTIRIQLFGVTTDTDWIRYDADDPLVEMATWSQPEDGMYEFRLNLTQDIWGYDSFYEGNTFVFQLNKAPERVGSLWGKTIVVDPGHSPDPGAIGPTGYTEAEANLGISLKLEQELKKKGARVIMTRRDSSPLSLYDRPIIANEVEADLFVSVHNNALPDGVDPYENYGTSAYYYHPHSAGLARSILEQIVRHTGQPNHGFYHGNLAVQRPTQYPAVLVECAFQIIPEWEARLKTDNFRRKIARAITQGIENFLESYDDRN